MTMIILLICVGLFLTDNTFCEPVKQVLRKAGFLPGERKQES